MKPFEWDEIKNELLKIIRGISFEEIRLAVLNNKILDDFPNRQQEKYPGQRMLVVEVHGYAYLVPYVENEEVIFLKTIIPSRKATKKYIKKG